VRQLSLDQLAEPGLEPVRLAELVDAAALPAGPRVSGYVRWRFGIALQDGDLMAVEGEEHGGAQPHDARPHHHYACHGLPVCVEKL
jgi:hypothetical protein